MGNNSAGARIGWEARRAREQATIDRLDAENKRLLAAFVEAVRTLTLEQLHGLSRETVQALADMGLIGDR